MLSLLEGDVVTSVPPSISQSFPSELQDFFARYGSYCTVYALTPSILPSLFFHSSSFPSLFSHPFFLLHYSHTPSSLHYSLTPSYPHYFLTFPSFITPSPPSSFFSLFPHPLLPSLSPTPLPSEFPHPLLSSLFPHPSSLHHSLIPFSFIILSPPLLSFITPSPLLPFLYYFLTPFFFPSLFFLPLLPSIIPSPSLPFVTPSPPSSFHFFHPLYPSSLPHPLLASFILLSPSTSFLPLFTHPTFLHYGGAFLTPSLPCWRKLPPSPSLLSSLLYLSSVVISTIFLCSTCE